MTDLHKHGFKKLTRIDNAWNLLTPYIKLLPDEEISSLEGVGRFLASDIISPLDVPHFNRSAMDGYAVLAEDTFGASPHNPKMLKIIDKIEINEISQKELKTGEAIKVATGSPIPLGANAVVKIEDTKLIDDKIEVYTPLSPGKNVSKKGEDVKKNDMILRKYHQLRPQDVTLFVACGIKTVKVFKKPKVAIISTGSELVELGSTPNIGQIIETNTHSLSLFTEQYGGIPIRLGIVDDDPEKIREILNEALKYDIIVFSGGTSVGEKDFLPPIMEKEGKLLVHGNAIRPGSPTAIAIVKDKPVFCLPGFPVATIIGFEVFVGPTIRKMQGAKILDPRPIVKAILKRGIPSRLGRRDFARVKLEKIEHEYFATPVRVSGSGIISSLVKADGVIKIPEDVEGIEKDSIVDVYLYLPRSV
ncbi:MAG: molybdopterin molybdotransferase MoeA [Candidatus Helarchaeota archaeon]